jgi:hypothetical protein
VDHVAAAVVVEAVGIAFLARLPAQGAVLGEGPAVIETLKCLAVALALSADLRTAVGAGVEQGMQFAIVVAGKIIGRPATTRVTKSPGSPISEVWPR